MIKGLVIPCKDSNGNTQKPYIKEFCEDEESAYNVMREVVGGWIDICEFKLNLFLHCFKYDCHVSVVVNDEGKLIDLPVNKTLHVFLNRLVLQNEVLCQTIDGNVMIVNYDAEGNVCNFEDEVLDYMLTVAICSYYEAEQMPDVKPSEPVVNVISF